MGGIRRVALAAAASLICMLAFAQAASARNIVVTSFDGTKIIAHYFPAAGATAANKAPTVLNGHGWGGTGSTAINGGTGESTQGFMEIGDLHRAGYNVLTWDARGFGGSGGVANVDGPDFEAKDVMALIDYVAKQPESQLDGPGDPRLGMTGSSYGGGIQLVTAALDRRIDVIVPDIAWNSLTTALFKDHSVKTGWGLLLGAAGVPTTLLPGVFSSAGVQLGTMSGHIVTGLTAGALSGNIAESDRAWFASRGPSYNMDKIRIPTLLTEGTVDTLFTLQEAITNYGILRGNGVPVKMMWHCGGHGTCTFPKGEKGHVERAALKWLKRYLVGDRTVDTGARFEWIDDKGTWHGSGDYPLTQKPPVEIGSSKRGGTLQLSPAESTNSPTEAQISSPAVELPFKAPSVASEVVGPPRVEFTYKGIGTLAYTFVYAQVVNRRTGQVFGNQVTPLPVKLDGKTHTLSRPLEAISVHAGPDSKMTLQIIGGSTVYGLQRSLGGIEFSNVSAKLPVGVPVVGHGQQTLRFGALGTTRAAAVRAKGIKRFRLCSRGGTVRAVSLAVKNRRGRVVARSRKFNLRGCKKPSVRKWKRAAKGRYTVVAAGRDASGNRVRTTKAFRLK